MSEIVTCARCPARWTGTRIAHCSGCHRSFGGLALFDMHRSHYGDRGTCLDPATLTVRSGVRAGEPAMFLRDGVYRGPEMDEAATARFETLSLRS
jgi:hypothetical protein